MERVFVDTSAWFAYANRADRDHEVIKATLSSFDGRLVTSNFVFDETVTCCAYRLGRQAAMLVGDHLLTSGSIDLVRITPEDERAAWALFKQRPDKQYSLTDCTSFILMRRLRLTTALALDEDFAQEGFMVRPA